MKNLDKLLDNLFCSQIETKNVFIPENKQLQCSCGCFYFYILKKTYMCPKCGHEYDRKTDKLIKQT